MQSQNRIFEDLSRIATGAAGTLAGVGREFETMVRERVKEFVGGLDLVTREEFDAVKEMAARARADADALKARLDAMSPAGTSEGTAAAGEAAPTGGAAAGGEGASI